MKAKLLIVINVVGLHVLVEHIKAKESYHGSVFSEYKAQLS